MNDIVIKGTLVLFSIVFGPSLSMATDGMRVSEGTQGREDTQPAVQSDGGIRTTTVRPARLRAKPRFRASTRAVIPEGADVLVYEYVLFEDGVFWHTKYGYEWGYVLAKYLDTNEEMLKLMEEDVSASPPTQVKKTEEIITYNLGKTPAPRGGFTLAINPAMTGAGTAFHLLDEILERSVLQPGIFNYNLETRRVSLDIDRGIAPFLSAHYDFGNRWKLYGNVLVFSTDGSKSGTFEAPASTATIKYLNSLYLWEGDFRLPFRRSFWFLNDKSPSGTSPLDWLGKTTFRSSYGHVSASYLLESGLDWEFAAEAGLSILSLNRTLARSIQGVIYLITPDLDGDGNPDDFDLDGRVEEFQNSVSLGTDNKASVSLSFGPRIGMRGGFKWHRWGIRGNWSQSWVGTRVNVKGKFRKTDSMKWIDPVTRITEGMFKINSESSYEDKVEAVVRIHEALVNVSYQVTDAFRVGLGVYYTLWQNVPAVPTFNYRDATWRLGEDTFSLSGINLTASFNIEPPRTYRRVMVPVIPLPESFEEAPAPVGGYEAIMENVAYPERARRSQTEGTVLVRAFVDSDGTVTETVIEQGIPGTGLDEAAENSVRSVSWKPARKEGKPVGAWVLIPIIFELDESKRVSGNKLKN